MQISIRRFIDSGGVESVVLKMDHTPIFWPNLYATIRYRNSHKSPNTIEKVLRSIGMCYVWAESERIDLDDKLLKDNFLEISEMDSLSYFLKLKSDAQAKIIEKTQAPSKKKVTKLESVRSGFSKANITSSEFASTEEIATRIRIAADYFKFQISRRQDSNKPFSEKFINFTKRAESNIAYLLQLVPRVRSSSLNEDLEGLSEEHVKAVEIAFQPHSEVNPFRVGFYQHRNYLVWRMLFETGMRRHELAAIKVQDVNYAEHRVVIRISKTLARTVPISQKLSDFFHEYVMNYWSKLPNKINPQGYLITCKTGGPIGLGTINLLFQTMREKVETIPTELTPHSLRRTWNDRFSHRIDISPNNQKPTHEQEKQIRNRLMGWSSGSAQAERYAKRHIKKKADEIAEKLANEFVEQEKLL